MKILIDARLYGLENAGIGRYVMELLDHLQSIDKINDYLILLRENQARRWKISGAWPFGLEDKRSLALRAGRWKIKVVDISHYSLQEQLELPKILNKLDFDIAHFPHFNVPIFWSRVPFIVTIHDLIKHTSTGSQTTTRTPFLYWLKYWGYKIVFKNAVTRAQKIIVPSQAVKDELLKTYNIPQEKIRVIYEGVDEVFSKEKAKSLELSVLGKYRINPPYVIYTGSAYPHKNLELLVEAVKLINTNGSELNLVIVSSRNVFQERLKDFIKKKGVEKFVKFLGFVEDSELAQLYKNAKAFVFPSLSEGFGLPGLEAMAAGCQVVCSDIPVFHEIYQDAATFFNPTKVEDMALKIKDAVDSNDTYHHSMVAKGKKRASQFSWAKMTEETLAVYKG